MVCFFEDRDGVSSTTSVVVLMASSRPQAKNWAFTLNNPLDGDAIDPALVDYMIVGKETGENGTFHFQGYVSFKKKMYLAGCKKLLARAHWEVAKGTPEQNRTYCSKDGDFQEIGTIPLAPALAATNKRKADYSLALEQAKKQRLYEIDPGVLIRHMSSLKQIARDHPPNLETNDELCGVWFFGPPGCGKSRSARW